MAEDLCKGETLQDRSEESVDEQLPRFDFGNSRLRR